MKKKFLMSLAIIGTATTMISYPIQSFAAPDGTEESETAEGESSSEGDETSESDGSETEESKIEETTAPPPDTSYYVIVTGEEGAKLYQQPTSDSSLSINIPIPKNTILHILEDSTDDSGVSWGFVNYADLKEGYVKLADLSTIQAKTAKEVVEEKFNGNWGQDFVTVNGSGTPVSFNSLSEEELKAAEESNAAAAKKGTSAAVAESEESTEVETNEDGSPVVEVYMETDENGETIPVETDENGNIIEKESETEAPEQKSGGFSIISFLIGFFSVILLEVIVAGAMILIRKLKQKKKSKGEETMPDGSEPPKKKGFKLPVPKIKLPKISPPKIKLPKIGGKKKKKGEDAE
ncbi:hypothetical protein UYO_2211 [Lachnospiraceae bacterium JC7]|nr:hypothetical protein UYO_2211 [Lachnospiraceae bacterium JC7]